jgi:hypothetical protein
MSSTGLAKEPVPAYRDWVRGGEFFDKRVQVDMFLVVSHA